VTVQSADDLKHNLDRMLERLAFVKALPAQVPGTYLHMGCGPQVLDGFLNIDKYHQDPRVVNWDMYDVQMPAESVDGIYSSHSLEHLPYRHAKLAIRNWYKLLRKGGVLYLAIPDLEIIMQYLLSDEIDEGLKWGWYVYTLFGYQVDPSKYAGSVQLDLPVDPGQFHTCGFTTKSIRTLLQNSGFTLELIFSYDGWGTPSIYLEARK
jgi:SAM-dependent methyltransferase